MTIKASILTIIFSLSFMFPITMENGGYFDILVMMKKDNYVKLGNVETRLSFNFPLFRYIFGFKKLPLTTTATSKMIMENDEVAKYIEEKLMNMSSKDVQEIEIIKTKKMPDFKNKKFRKLRKTITTGKGKYDITLLLYDGRYISLQQTEGRLIFKFLIEDSNEEGKSILYSEIITDIILPRSEMEHMKSIGKDNLYKIIVRKSEDQE